MRRTTPPLLALALLSASAGSAEAAVFVEVNGATLTVIGSAGNDAVRFTYFDPAAPGQPGYTWVDSTGGVADPLPPQCVHINPMTGAFDMNSALCEDSGSAPALRDLQIVLGGGDDSATVDVAFITITATLGAGADTYMGVPGVGDTVFADDGEQDTIDCRGGADAAYIDLGLDLVTGCATVAGPQPLFRDGFENLTP